MRIYKPNVYKYLLFYIIAIGGSTEQSTSRMHLGNPSAAHGNFVTMKDEEGFMISKDNLMKTSNHDRLQTDNPGEIVSPKDIRAATNYPQIKKPKFTTCTEFYKPKNYANNYKRVVKEMVQKNKPKDTKQEKIEQMFEPPKLPRQLHSIVGSSKRAFSPPVIR